MNVTLFPFTYLQIPNIAINVSRKNWGIKYLPENGILVIKTKSRYKPLIKTKSNMRTLVCGDNEDLDFKIR